MSIYLEGIFGLEVENQDRSIVKHFKDLIWTIPPRAQLPWKVFKMRIIKSYLVMNMKSFPINMLVMKGFIFGLINLGILI